MAWCVGEHPYKLWRNIGLERVAEYMARTTVRCPEFFVGKWRAHYNHWTVIPYDDHHSIEHPKGYLNPGWETNLSWYAGSTIHALALVCAQGATHIELYGCDMKGTGGWGCDYDPDIDEKRWTNERISLTRAIQDASDHGVTISRIGD